MIDFSNVVLPNGKLNETTIAKQEEINQQKNIGRLSLYRFWIETDTDLKSYIFKPTKDSTPIKFELWFQNELVPLMEHVRSPKLLAHRMDEVQNIFWMIYEDIGSIEPAFDRKVRIKAAKKMAVWHRLPLQTIASNTASFMPYIDETMQSLCRDIHYYAKLLQNIEVTEREITSFFDLINKMNGVFPSELTVCHGDYHCLNLLNTSDELVILDWEFIQVNSIFWDFYTLLDMATPRYRIQINKSIREEALRSYSEERNRLSGWVASKDFVYNYHLYSLIYSIWILALVASDLEDERFEQEILLIQKQELKGIIRECLDVVLYRN
ncbi:hypothetical protein Back11_15080 [Paenibacillus baekrokdamisoli]|uniref:Aminoglycoside phosphotransferase domain-containing protein n=1 Tax=Paenibacillus baekrokdamisoli TaxID=1712516 RepID=A0A3G9J5T8_9BACL|nr:phosphotransferase [Paenibacillus baekrokdamisoli]MBB3072773.1 thiamine kinase-like enzyme [Paenibacillus baekrokdamisoli]BBH20163.1 hypothetical protein Back11_15080 [Paenibacillus baekrokdamisoli]